eukprot:8737774-Alexandrium_andersonii.AAC.1
MALAHLKKRLAPGVVFSLTDDMLAAATKNDVSSARVDPSKIARSMFALAQNADQTHKDLPEQPAEGLNFLWVVCGPTGRRQLLHSHAHATRANEVAAMAMSFSHFHGGRQGIFYLCHDVITLDLLALIRHAPVQVLFSELALWEKSDLADLKILMPKLGRNAGMLPMVSLEAIPRASTALTPLHPQQHLVATNIQKILEALGEDVDTPLYHDIISGNLRAEDGSISLPMSLAEVSDLCSVGVFERAHDDFGDAPVVLNREALSWKAAYLVRRGSIDITSHLPHRLSSSHQLGKLDMLLLMSRDGWQAGKPHDFYAVGADKKFFFDFNRTKWYFAALLASIRILSAMPSTNANEDVLVP